MPPCDIEKYRKHVEHFDLTDDQKTELIEAVYCIMKSHVDRAFGKDPVHMCMVQAKAGKNALKAPIVIDLEAREISRSVTQLTGVFNETGNNQGKGKIEE